MTPLERTARAICRIEPVCGLLGDRSRGCLTCLTHAADVLSAIHYGKLVNVVRVHLSSEFIRDAVGAQISYRALKRTIAKIDAEAKDAE